MQFNSRYLTTTDYNIIIQTDMLSAQLCQNNPNTLYQAEQVAQEEIYSLLTQRYDLTSEFTSTLPWQYGITYSAGERVYLDYATYSATASYNLGDSVISSNQAFTLTGTTSLGPTTSFPEYWTNIGSQGTFYNVFYPSPIFNYPEPYALGDVIFYQGFTWSCETATPPIDETAAMQYVYIGAIPINVYPNSPANKSFQFWQPSPTYYITPVTGATYTVYGTYSIGGTVSSTASIATYGITASLPTNNTFWKLGDNRSQLMILHYMEMALWYLNKTITPTNIPNIRSLGYKDAIKYLEQIATGQKNSPILQDIPTQGEPIRYGGLVRKTQTW